ncbi:MAG: class I SAM-dependent methyltransferase [Hydrotalea sp.]|nr:class I SAM-dependent methyltransferase [Hydrotalea sp.]
MNNDEKVDFGFEKIDRGEKTGRVRDLFAGVANKYDVMNDLMSLGLHRHWKDQFVARIPNNSNLLDVAGGTGDIAIRYLKNAAPNDKRRATVLDLTAEMMTGGQQNADRAGLFGNIDFVVGNAEELPFADETFDAVTISFGLRNVTNKEKALREMRRVLKPGGKFLCLEFSKVVLPMLDQLYEKYNFTILPLLGKYVARNEDSYRYLAESIKLFYSQDELVEKMKLGGFERIGYENLTGGVVAIHHGYAL